MNITDDFTRQHLRDILKQRARRYFKDQNREETSTSEYLTFRRGTAGFAVSVPELQDVHTAPEIVPLPLVARHIAGVVPVRGEITAVYDLYRFLYDHNEEGGEQEYLIRGGGDLANIALIADELLSVIELEDNSINPLPVSLAGCEAYLKGITENNEIVISLSGLRNHEPFFNA